ncbi:MAG: hypothetical protein ACREXV_07420 [Polaromonas sp.]
MTLIEQEAAGILGDSTVDAGPSVITLTEGPAPVSLVLIENGELDSDASTGTSVSYQGSSSTRSQSATSNNWDTLYDSGSNGLIYADEAISISDALAAQDATPTGVQGRDGLSSCPRRLLRTCKNRKRRPQPLLRTCKASKKEFPCF